jgi:hypothetical protein
MVPALLLEGLLVLVVAGRLAEGLQVGLLPEQAVIASMGSDVIDDRAIRRRALAGAYAAAVPAGVVVPDQDLAARLLPTLRAVLRLPRLAAQ